MNGLDGYIRFSWVVALLAAVGCSTPEYVGVRDCDELVKQLNIPDFAPLCERCQGADCGAEPGCKRDFPCEDGKIVVQGCEEDSDCSDLNALCANYTAHPHHVCSLSDAI